MGILEYKWHNLASWATSTTISQGGRGHWTVYYTIPQSFMITISYLMAYQPWGLLLNLIGWFIKLSFRAFQPLIVIYRRSNFVYQNWWCTSIYRPLSYPFISRTTTSTTIKLSRSMHLRFWNKLHIKMVHFKRKSVMLFSGKI